jgi:hypothetical protein
MPSPFPGMDPYLEGHLWPDVHRRLATEISDQLMPLIVPKYVARLETRMVKDFVEPAELGITFPDVEVLKTLPKTPPLEWSTRLATAPVISPPELVLPTLIPVNTSLTTVVIRDAKSRALVTSIEILSPVNKRKPGIREYRHKRESTIASAVHLLEIDFLRRGTRPVPKADLPNAPYFVFLTRARQAQLEIWPVRLPDPLPVVPVPLRHPDPDVPLDMATLFKAIYDKAHYELTIDYTEPPEIPLSKEDAAWADELLRQAGLRP